METPKDYNPQNVTDALAHYRDMSPDAIDHFRSLTPTEVLVLKGVLVHSAAPAKPARAPRKDRGVPRPPKGPQLTGTAA